jgi:hypothetical protein
MPIALDARIQAIFQKIGIQMPNNFGGNSKIYEEIENDILNKICTHLELFGVELNRMLYQNYEEIMKINH